METMSTGVKRKKLNHKISTLFLPVYGCTKVFSKNVFCWGTRAVMLCRGLGCWR